MQKVETGAEAGAKAGVEGQIAAAICRELGVSRPHVESVVRLLDGKHHSIPGSLPQRTDRRGSMKRSCAPFGSAWNTCGASRTAGPR